MNPRGTDSIANATPPTVAVEIDGETLRLPKGMPVLEALQRLGRAPVALCHDPRLAPVGDCWSCAVEVTEGDGAAHTRPACREPLRDGLRVRSRSPALDAFRRGLLERLAAHVAAPDAALRSQRPLHHALAEAGIVSGRAQSDPAAIDASHPLIRFDPSQCIACFRCVRICEELQGQSVWHVLGRGPDLRLAADGGVPLGESSCVACGACVDTCPSAALVDAHAATIPDPETWTRTVCPYCGVGCVLEAGTAAGRVVAVRPVLEAAVNRGHLCVKGRYAHGYLEAPDRLRAPRRRRPDGRWETLTWDVALDDAAQRLAAIRAAHGPAAIGVLGSARGTNEEAYLAQKFARLALGTDNVDCCARVCHAPSAAALGRMLGTGAATNGFDDLELAQLLLVVGANPLANHPVLGARLRRRARAGVPLIVIDPRRTELAAIADVHLAPHPGTDIPVLTAMAQTLLAESLVDRAFVAARVDGFAAFADHVAHWPPERAAVVSGVPAEAIRAAARLYGTHRPGYCVHGLGLTEHPQGTDTVSALIDLALITGNLGRPGAGINPLRGQNNVQGAALMGLAPGQLTGGAPLARARPRLEALWGAPLPAAHGLTLPGMLDAARAVQLKALYVIGFDVYLTLAQADETARALGALEFLIVQDPFPNETARAFAHLLLPSDVGLEKDGTVMNAERRIQRVRRVLPPPPGVRDDGAILAGLAARLGHGAAFTYPGPEAVWDEIRVAWPEVAGIDYARLAHDGVLWPCRDGADPGTRVLHADAFAHGPRATLALVPWEGLAESPDAAYPLRLTTGRELAAFNAGTMTGRSAVRALRPTDTLDLHPDDAAARGIADGDRVRLESHHGAVELPARLDARLCPGTVFASFHDPAVFLNRVTGPARDAVTGAPAYKLTAVQVRRIAPG